MPAQPFIHHETVEAETASGDAGEGRFDVIEDRGGFQVFDSGAGLYLSEHATLEEAVASAKDAAAEYDRQFSAKP